MGLRFVHLNSDREYAVQVANAKQSHAVVVVRAAAATNAGQVFRRASSRVWLTELIEPVFLAMGPNTHMLEPCDRPSPGILSTFRKIRFCSFRSAANVRIKSRRLGGR